MKPETGRKAAKLTIVEQADHLRQERVASIDFAELDQLIDELQCMQFAAPVVVLACVGAAVLAYTVRAQTGGMFAAMVVILCALAAYHSTRSFYRHIQKLKAKIQAQKDKIVQHCRENVHY